MQIILKKVGRILFFSVKRGIFEPLIKDFVRVELLTVLKNYLETHKRLIVPQLGAFIVKEPGVSVVFSELMKRDDGILRDLLCSEGRSEVEAAGLIDRFVFGVRQTVESGLEYRLDGFGMMRPGPNGTIGFVYRPADSSAQRSAEPIANAVAPIQHVVAAGSDVAVPEVNSGDAQQPQSRKESPSQRIAHLPSTTPHVDPAQTVGRPAVPTSSVIDAVPAKPVAKVLPETDVVPKRTIASPYPQPTSRRVSDESNPNRAHIDTARIAETMRMAFGNEAVADAVQPKKGTVSAVYEHSDEEPDEDYNEPSTQRRGVDRFLLVAILAVVIAVAAIAFGFWREARERQAEAEMLQMEQFDTRFE